MWDFIKFAYSVCTSCLKCYLVYLFVHSFPGLSFTSTVIQIRVFIFILQGDIQAKYESIDKDTPIPTDRQVLLWFVLIFCCCCWSSAVTWMTEGYCLLVLFIGLFNYLQYLVRGNLRFFLNTFRHWIPVWCCRKKVHSLEQSFVYI